MTARKVTLELTNECQLKCTMCPRHHLDMKVGYMPDYFFRTLMSQLPQEATVITFWRGESTLHPWFDDLMVFARNWLRNGTLIVATNGLSITMRDTPIWGLMAAHVVSVSIHNSLSYQGLVRLLKQRDVYNKKLKVTATMVEGEKTGVHPGSLEIADEVRIYTEHTKKGKWGSVPEFKAKARTECARLRTDLVVTWDGRISRCCYVWEPIPGLSAKTTSLSDIINSPELKMISESYPDKICRACSQWSDSRTI